MGLFGCHAKYSMIRTYLTCTLGAKVKALTHDSVEYFSPTSSCQPTACSRSQRVVIPLGDKRDTTLPRNPQRRFIITSRCDNQGQMIIGPVVTANALSAFANPSFVAQATITQCLRAGPQEANAKQGLNLWGSIFGILVDTVYWKVFQFLDNPWEGTLFRLLS